MNIYLIGYRGTGKTTLGRALSRKFRRKFVDLDLLIEEREGRKIEEIFAKDGEKYFRDIEHKVLSEIARQSDLIVSTGGGIVILPENREIIKSTGITIYLTADDKTIYKRIKNDKNRPPLTSKPPLEEVHHLLSIRKPFYEELADITIDTSVSNIEDCSKKIIEFIKIKGPVI